MSKVSIKLGKGGNSASQLNSSILIESQESFRQQVEIFECPNHQKIFENSPNEKTALLRPIRIDET